MSYSRWGSSWWYTYWCADSGDTIDEQMLAINGDKVLYRDVCGFNYSEMVNYLKNKLKDDSGEDFYELAGYVFEFIADVNKKFNTTDGED